MWAPIFLLLLCIIAVREGSLFLAPEVDMSAERDLAERSIFIAAPHLNISYDDLRLLSNCVRDTPVKFVGCDSEGTTAYVTPWRFWAPSEIYITTVGMFLSQSMQISTLIHECTHLAWGSRDYAYTYDPCIDSLTREEVDHNADSLTALFTPYVHAVVSGAPLPWQLQARQEESAWGGETRGSGSSLLRGVV